MGVLTADEEDEGKGERNKNSQEKYGIKFSEYTGKLKESWTILWEPGAVMLSEFGKKAKQYNGIVKSPC